VGRIAPAGGALQQLRIMGENGSVDSQAEGETPLYKCPASNRWFILWAENHKQGKK
jgi:hypothetical protein